MLGILFILITLVIFSGGHQLQIKLLQIKLDQIKLLPSIF